MPFSLAPDRAAAARALAAALVPGQRVCLTTHVNPDGDGLGSEAGLAHLLRDRGIDTVITNPTPTPPRFAFLFEDLPGGDRTADAVRELRRADAIVVLDISDLGRLGMLGETVRDRRIIDQNSYGKGQAAKRHQINGFAQRAQNHQRGQNRERN